MRQQFYAAIVNAGRHEQNITGLVCSTDSRARLAVVLCFPAFMLTYSKLMASQL